MVEYVAEVYQVAGGSVEPTRSAARARRAADELTLAGRPVRYLRSTFVPDDEVCFHFFSGRSAEDVRAAVELAGIDCERIVEVRDVSG